MNLELCKRCKGEVPTSNLDLLAKLAPAASQI